MHMVAVMTASSKQFLFRCCFNTTISSLPAITELQI